MTLLGAQNSPSTIWDVTKVVDGDIFYAEREGEKVKFRLIGINTPEKAHRYNDYQAEPFHQEATDFLKSLIDDQSVRLVYDVQSRDRYQRDLVYVYSADGQTFINMELVKAGWAEPMTIAPNVAHADDFVAASREARKQGRGMWKEAME